VSSETQDLAHEYGNFVAGKWVKTDSTLTVYNPYSGSELATVTVADQHLVETALSDLVKVQRELDFPTWQRAEVLDKAAFAITESADRLAKTLSLEAGKPFKQAMAEVQRASSTFKFSAAQARTFAGECIPMDAANSGVGKVGFTLRIPVGTVAAITPFNFPLNLVAHKLGPAIAAGCTVALKPASATPLSAIGLLEILLEAGLPSRWIALLCGSGLTVGKQLTNDDRVDAVSFTGSADVGWAIRSSLPRKKVNLELGSIAPLIVDNQSNWQQAAKKAAVHAFSHAGQSCISTQRILVHEQIVDSFTELLCAEVQSLKVGDPLDPSTDVGPLIDQANRDRVKSWIDEAIKEGAKIVAGGQLGSDGTLQPTVLKDPSNLSKVWQEELFGPAVTVTEFSSFDQALELANDSRFGLNAGVYTDNITLALKAAQTLNYGGVLINEVPTFRSDQQPYGGVGESGNTREGPAFAVRELTQERLVLL